MEVVYSDNSGDTVVDRCGDTVVGRYSAILHSQADSLRSHVILHGWIAFYSAFLNIHRSGVLTALAWLVPHEADTVSARSVYTIQPCTMSLYDSGSSGITVTTVVTQ